MTGTSNSDTELPTVSAVVLNYNTYDQTIDCVGDLLRQDYPELDVVIVDNHSTNQSFNVLRQAFRDEARVSLVETGENLGYARGNNYGCRYRLSKGSVQFFLIVNSDIRITDPLALRQLVRFSNTRPDTGGVGPKVINTKGFIQGPYAKPNVILRSLRYLFPLFPYIDYVLKRSTTLSLEAKRCYAVVGAIMLLKAAPFSQIGMFDERTFLGAEEYILAEKLMRVGLGFYFCPYVVAQHNHGKSKVSPTERQGLQAYARGVESMTYYFREYQAVRPALVWLYQESAMLYGRYLFRFRKYVM